MKEQPILTTEELRRQLNNLLGYAQHGSTLEQRIDVEVRLLLARYNELQRERAQTLERLQAQAEDGKRASEHTRTLERVRTEAHAIRAKLECVGELLVVEPVVIAACLSTIALHQVEHEESSFEHGYPLLGGYFLGENLLPFPRLDFLQKRRSGNCWTWTRSSKQPCRDRTRGDIRSRLINPSNNPFFAPRGRTHIATACGWRFFCCPATPLRRLVDLAAESLYQDGHCHLGAEYSTEARVRTRRIPLCQGVLS